jgi:hypothetical protein
MSLTCHLYLPKYSLAKQTLGFDMIDTYVSIELTEEEYDLVIEWLSEQEISTGLGKLYDRLIEAAEFREDEQTDD